MGQTFYFGGGASGSTMHPVVLALVCIASVAVIFLPRRYGVTPILIIGFLTPFGEQLYVGGFHLYTLRILICAGGLRLVRAKSSGESIFRDGVSPIDRIFFTWALFRSLTFVLLHGSGALVAQVGFCLDAYGGYILFRYFVQDKEDVIRLFKTMSLIAGILAPCMLFEYATRINVFNYINTSPITPWIRNGKFRAQGTFSENSITAGSFGAVLLPLFYWLWRSGREKIAGISGLIASTIIVITSVASTAAMAYLGAIVGLCFWPLRKRMRTIRWGILLGIVCLAMVMKAPVWFIIARVDFIGGNGWDRAEIIDLTVRHFSEWWLLGTSGNASWGTDTWDSCNQFVAEALSGGLVSLVLFITLIKRGFSLIGDARKKYRRDVEVQWFYWCVGVGLFANVMAFTGVDYMDMMQDWWYVYLCIISAVTVSVWVKPQLARALQETSCDAYQTHVPACGLTR